MRPKQWTKNLLVFAATLFTASFTAESLLKATIAFACMCLASSAVYVFNDIGDVESDRLHPKKKNRPLARGAISVGAASFLGVAILAGSIALALQIGIQALWILGAYLGLQTAYNLGLKHVAISDVFCISVGFVLRAVMGAVAIQVVISGWLLFCTGALALMLGFSKRRSEFLRMGDEKGATRKSLEQYSKPILDALVLLFAAGALSSYGVYSIESETAQKHPGLMLTTFFVAYGVSRYLYLTLHEGDGEEPESILVKDGHIIFSVVGFIVMALIAMTDRMPDLF